MKDGPKGEHLTERLARETVDFITAPKNERFFAYLSFYAVHNPLMAPKELVEKYEAKSERMRLGDDFAAEEPRKNRTVHSHATYAAMIEAVDTACGKVLDALERNGLVDNTLVIFTSDNGGLSTSEGSPTSNLPHRAGRAGCMKEGSAFR